MKRKKKIPPKKKNNQTQTQTKQYKHHTITLSAELSKTVMLRSTSRAHKLGVAVKHQLLWHWMLLDQIGETMTDRFTSSEVTILAIVAKKVKCHPVQIQYLSTFIADAIRIMVKKSKDIPPDSEKPLIEKVMELEPAEIVWLWDRMQIIKSKRGYGMIDLEWARTLFNTTM